MMTCLTSFFKRKSPPVQETVDLDDEVSTVQNSCSYSYKELSIATENFSLENKIGEGGFGRVYKGSLRDGTVVAIKVLSAESRQGMREFLTEIKVIADIEHDNLVKLHGYCAEGNHRILVYGYLENNSLAQTFFSTTSDINFDWPARRMICIGVAKGLAFLHEEVKPYIVHRDIKASNILLDKDLLPKISDFGLAKLFPANMTHISTRVAGTVGYLAPEYAIRGQLTRKADVYSFGVLLLEIVAGRPNTNKRLEPDEQYLLERTWELHEKGELESLVDASIRKDCTIEEACKYLKISLLCTQEKPKLRPSMSTVVKMLTGEISLSDDHKIMKPGLISEFRARGPEGRKGKLDDKNASYNISEGSGGSRPDSYSSSGMETSHATMTFTSIYDRSS